MRKNLSVLRNILLFIFALALFCLGCNQDRYDIDRIADGQWTPEVAFPLLSTSLTAEDIINNVEEEGTSFEVNDQIVTLIYQSTVLSSTTNELVDFGDIPFTGSDEIGVTVPSIPNGITYDLDLSQPLELNLSLDIIVDSAFFNRGILQLEVFSEIQHKLDLEVTIPELTIDGTPFTTSFEMNYEGTIPVLQNFEFLLEDFYMDFTGTPGDNVVTANINATITGLGNPVNMDERVGFNGVFEEVDVKYLYGVVQDLTLPEVVDSVAIGISEQIQGFGDFVVAEPEVEVTFTNSFGFPISTTFTKFEGRNYISGNVVDIANSPDIPNPIILNYPAIDEFGESKVTTYNVAGSDITDFFNLKPTELYYQITPGSTTSAGQQTFLIDTSRFSIFTKVSIPFHGSAIIYDVRDTAEINIDSDLRENIETLELNITTTNSLPVDFQMQVYLVDSNFITIDSLFEEDLFFIDGRSNEPLQSIIVKTDNFPLSSSKIANLVAATNLILVGNAETDNPPENIKIRIEDYIDFYIGAKAKLR